MSPEQAQAGAVPDVRTDVHALGALLYALLTGHPPRELDQEAAGDPLEFHRRLRQTEARPASQLVDPELFGSDGARRRARSIDRDIEAVVARALALDPEERYGSAEAFAAYLLRWHGGLPVSARRVGLLGRLRRRIKRRPVETGLVAAAALALISVGVATLRSRSGEIQARERYQEQLATTREVNRFFTSELMLRAMPELDGPQVPAIDLLRAASHSSVEYLERSPEVAVSVGGALMEVFERMGASEEADAELERAAPLATQLAADDPQRIVFELQRASLLEGRSLWLEAEPAYREVLSVVAGLPDEQPELEARAMSGLGSVLLSLGELDEAEVWLVRARKFYRDSQAADSQASGRRSTPSRDHSLGHLALLGRLSALAMARGDFDTAAATLEEQLAVFEQRFEKTTPFALAAHLELARLELDRRRPSDALPHARQALTMADELYEPTHPDRLSAVNNLASCFSSAGAFDEALEIRREVLSGRLAQLGPDNPSVGIAQNNLASTLMRS